MTDVVVVEPLHGRAGEPRPVPHAGVAESIGEDEVLRADQGRDHPDVRQVSAAEDDGPLGAFHLGEERFELGIERMAARDEPRGPGAGAVPLDRLAGGGDHRRMMGQAEVVVATERDVLLASRGAPDPPPSRSTSTSRRRSPRPSAMAS